MAGAYRVAQFILRRPVHGPVCISTTAWDSAQVSVVPGCIAQCAAIGCAWSHGRHGARTCAQPSAPASARHSVCVCGWESVWHKGDQGCIDVCYWQHKERDLLALGAEGSDGAVAR